MLSWSPWEKIDPLCSAATAARRRQRRKYGWAGNKNIGVAAWRYRRIASSIKIDLAFLKPFACHNNVEFKLQPALAEPTSLGHGRAATILKDLHSVLQYGEDVAHNTRSLANLKSLAESDTQAKHPHGMICNQAVQTKLQLNSKTDSRRRTMRFMS